MQDKKNNDNLELELNDEQIKEVKSLFEQMTKLNTLQTAYLCQQFAALFQIDLTQKMMSQISSSSSENNEKNNEDTKKEKSTCHLVLTEFDSSMKVTAIKFLKDHQNCNLADAKAILEKIPFQIIQDVKKEECEKIIQEFQSKGLKLKIETK